MKNAFKSAGSQFQFKYKFGALNGGSNDSDTQDSGPETSVLSEEELAVHGSQETGPQTEAETAAPGDSDASSEGGEDLELSGADSGETETIEPEEVETVLAEAEDEDTTLASTDGEVSQSVTATYSDEAIAELKFMIEEEKLAGDIYEVFYNMYGLKIFNNIAQSEDQHFSALIGQAENLGLDVDQFLFEPAGTFDDPVLQEMYDTLLAQGAESVTGALEVGKAIEEKDMVDIAEAIEDVEGTTLAGVYENLLAGSANHLEAFDSLLMM